MQVILGCNYGFFTAKNRDLVIQRIEDQAFTAQEKFGEFSVRGDKMSSLEKLAVLGEEFGEVCQAIVLQIDEGRFDDNPHRGPHKKDLKLELAQVAGVCLNWLEALEE